MQYKYYIEHNKMIVLQNLIIYLVMLENIHKPKQNLFTKE